MTLIFIFLIFLSALFSSAEIAFFSLGRAKALTLVEKNKKNAKLIWALKQKPQKLLITILIGNNIVNVLTASLATALTTKTFGSYGVGIATGVVTLVILVFGEITPKSIAQKNNILIAQKTAKLLTLLNWIFAPIIWLLTRWNNFIIKKFIKTAPGKLVSEEEIRALTRLGVEAGAIDFHERELIERVFRFDDILVREIMTPRYKMISLNGEVPVDQIAHFISQSGFSRYPVYLNDQDHVIGYVHVNDIMKALNSNQREQPLRELIRPVITVRDSRQIESLFRLMIKKHEHLATVKKPGKNIEIVGLVTLEDILEELVGEIGDETDKSKTAKKKYIT
jgi:putative hemolysin